MKNAMSSNKFLGALLIVFVCSSFPVFAEDDPSGTEYYLLEGWQYGYEVLSLDEDGTYNWRTVTGDEDRTETGTWKIFPADMVELLVVSPDGGGKVGEYFFVCSKEILVLYTKREVRGVYSADPNDYLKAYEIIPTSELTETIGGKEVLYTAEDLKEGLYDRFWAEGDPGDGTGEALFFNFYSFDGAPDSETTVEGAVIFNGAPLRYFDINNRVKDARFEFDNGREYRVELFDSPAPQVILFSGNDGELINKGSMHIESVYPGSKYTDCCMTRVLFFGAE
jgi:hypothetical protein